MARKIPLPRGWKRRVKSSIVHVVRASATADLADSTVKMTRSRLSSADKIGGLQGIKNPWPSGEADDSGRLRRVRAPIHGQDRCLFLFSPADARRAACVHPEFASVRSRRSCPPLAGSQGRTPSRGRRNRGVRSQGPRPGRTSCRSSGNLGCTSSRGRKSRDGRSVVR